MGRHQVSIVTDWTIPRASVHMAVFYPPPPPPQVSYLHAEFPAMLQHGGEGAGGHMFTCNVYHQWHPIAQDGHDCGKWIGHLTYPVHSILFPFHTWLSKRKTMFGASTVRMNGKQAGIIDLSGGCPMLMCADPLSVPAQWAPTNITNTVFVGSTTGDLVGGWAGIVTNAVIELIIYKVADGLAHWLTKGDGDIATAVVEYAIKQWLKFLLPYTKPSKAVKKRVQEFVDSPEASSVPVTPTKDPSVFRTESPFGDATITVTAESDGSFCAESGSPTSCGGRVGQRCSGLGVFAAADAEQQDQRNALGAAFQDAPEL